MWAYTAPKPANPSWSINTVYINADLARKERVFARIGLRQPVTKSKLYYSWRSFFDRRSVLEDSSSRKIKHKSGSGSPELMTTLVERLFGPAIFEASKLNVLFLGVDEDNHFPRTYTLTHSDITAHLTLAISQTINKAQLQGWYSRLQRDEVVAEWREDQGQMSLHVHCHISGGHWLLDVMAKLRFSIFRKELPRVLKAFRHGDEALFNSHPAELEGALVWVYFHSKVKEFNRVECWGPLEEAAKDLHEDKVGHQPFDLEGDKAGRGDGKEEAMLSSSTQSLSRSNEESP